MVFKYQQLPEAGKRLARIPRYGRLIGRLPESVFEKLRTVADVYWYLYFYRSGTGGDTGLLDSGLRVCNVGDTIGMCRGTYPAIDDEFRKWQIESAATILGAIAFRMYSKPGRPDQSNNTAETKKTAFLLCAEYGPQQDYLENTIDVADWQRWLNAVLKMDSHELDYLTFSDSTHRFVWTDVTVQVYFAAYWACRWASDEQIRLMRDWLPDPLLETNNEYGEFWKMVVDMPAAKELEVRWERLLSPLFDGTWRDEKGNPSVLRS